VEAPGSRVTSRLCEPMGYQPLATESADFPANGTAASPSELYAPTNVSRSVSKPAAGALTPKTA